MKDIQEQVEWLESIKINQLNNRALTIAFKLARTIRRENGVTVRLQDEAIALRLAEQVESINSYEVRLLFRQFLEEALGVNQPASNKTDDPSAEVQLQRAKVQ